MISLFNKNKWMVALVIFIMSCQSISAQTDGSHDLLAKSFPYVFLVIVLLIVAWGAKTIYDLTLLFIKVKEDQIRTALGLPAVAAPKVKRVNWWDRFYKKATDAVPVEREQDIMLDHDYDGIRELDNNLPPWWLWMFYISIVYGILYFGYYHMSPYGKSSTEQYEMSMAHAAAEVEAFRALQADIVDEDNLELLEDEQSLELGKAVFINKCVACHLASGGGSVGPNLTDDYWIHGGSLSDVYKTIKYGVPEKGMISWQTQLRPKEMHQVASYILASLYGTNPPDGKEPQGDKYVSEEKPEAANQ